MNNAKLRLAMHLLEVIMEMADQGEDFSLLLRNYNELVEGYSLPIQKIKLVNVTEFDFYNE